MIIAHPRPVTEPDLGLCVCLGLGNLDSGEVRMRLSASALAERHPVRVHLELLLPVHGVTGAGHPPASLPMSLHSLQLLHLQLWIHRDEHLLRLRRVLCLPWMVLLLLLLLLLLLQLLLLLLLLLQDAPRIAALSAAVVVAAAADATVAAIAAPGRGCESAEGRRADPDHSRWAWGNGMSPGEFAFAFTPATA
jgi:hypothetical protein